MSLSFLFFVLTLELVTDVFSPKKGNLPLAMSMEEAPLFLPETENWIYLFNGKDTKGWHSYLRKSVGTRWQVKDGVLTLLEVKAPLQTPSDGGDLITEEEFEDFELDLEWRISPCGNSGIFFHVVENMQYANTYETGPEMQILDNTCHPDARKKTHRAGALYDLIPSQLENVLPAGEWNHVRIKVQHGAVEFHLNRLKIIEFNLRIESWNKLVRKSKFRRMSSFGKSGKGHIGLQDHGDEVSFRNIRIRRL